MASFAVSGVTHYKDNVLRNIITFAVTSNVAHYFCMANNLTEVRLLTNVTQQE